MKKRMYLIPAGFILIFLSFTVFGERGLLRIHHLNREKEDFQERTTLVRLENDQLRREIEALKTDRRYLESLARKDFGFVRKNEIIYQFPAKK
jgi:cell division protein FtsB